MEFNDALLEPNEAAAFVFCREFGERPASAALAPVYGWFTEGFDTLDLKEAEGCYSMSCRLEFAACRVCLWERPNPEPLLGDARCQ
jgi:hypothetical protein